MRHPRKPSAPLRRILENAGLLSFATLLVMSVALGRYTGALVWCGALLVFFAHAWEGRIRHVPEPAADAATARSRRFNLMRWIGVALAVSGAIALAL